MINERINKGTQVQTTDNTLKDLELFQSFFYQNFRNHQFYEKMRLTSNQPARLYATAKTHKFENLDDISIYKLKFRPIIDQTGTFTYDAAKVIDEYKKPLAKNEYRINDCQEFLDMLKDLRSLKYDENYISYNLDSVFTNIPLNDAIEYVIHKIYDEKVLQPIRPKIRPKRVSDDYCTN